jgi:hypothetical protein
VIVGNKTIEALLGSLSTCLGLTVSSMAPFSNTPQGIFSLNIFHSWIEDEAEQAGKEAYSGLIED